MSNPVPNSSPPNPEVSADAGFAPGPPVAQLCKFSLPKLFFKFGLVLPNISFPPAIPIPKISIGLNCSLSNPLDVTAGLSYGGGRIPTRDPDPDLIGETI